MVFRATIDSLEEVKSIRLDLLIKFHQFCHDNKIHYSLAYGTLLGAIRHKGYIPWDDDIDVMMLREDYVKFENRFPHNDVQYDFITLRRSNKWNRPYGKFYNRNTLEIENANNNVGIGIGIDVFPIDDVPDNEQEFKFFRNKRLIFVQASSIKCILLSKERSLLKNLFVLVGHIVLLPFSHRRIAMIIDRYANSNNGKGYSRVFRSCDAVKVKESFPKSFFKSYVDVVFEGYHLKAICSYDEYLRSCYGTYMQLPPEDKRISTHHFEAYWLK